MVVAVVCPDTGAAGVARAVARARDAFPTWTALTFKERARHLKAVGLPAAIADIPGPHASVDELMAHMAHDKKVSDGRLTFILVKGIGHAFITRDVPADAVRDILAD
jgi:3-dehydroquinate synthetase